MDNITGRIYIHKNKLNDKCYVGQSRYKSLTKRWAKGSGYKHSIKFYNAIKKYGWDAFDHIILPEVYITVETLNQAEIDTIAEYDAINNGYNVAPGGNFGNTGLKHTEETKAKISLANKGRIQSKEARAKIGAASKGRTHICSKEAKARLSIAQTGHTHIMPEEQKAILLSVNTGRKCTEETKEKLRLAHKGYKLSKEQKAKISVSHIGKRLSDIDKTKLSQASTNKKQIQCVETNAVYSSITDCSIATGIPRSSISKNINGSTYSAHKFHFKYTEVARCL